MKNLRLIDDTKIKVNVITDIPPLKPEPLDSKIWIPIERPGQFTNKNRPKGHPDIEFFDRKIQWRLAWKIGNSYFEEDTSRMLFERSYEVLFNNNPFLLDTLLQTARDVYDNDVSDIECGLDYGKLKPGENHIQDIAIRRVVHKIGRTFNENGKLVRIHSRSEDPIGKILSPYYAPFFNKRLIDEDKINGLWMDNSIECFYQSNKWIMMRDYV